jgi:hypothetical protein
MASVPWKFPSLLRCAGWTAVLAAGTLLHAGGAVASEALKISSEPAGASVEINGTLVGQTPVTLEYPGVYFHKPHTAFGERLGHAMVLKISKTGFAVKQVILSDGPFDWIGLTGKKHGTYFVLRSDHFDFKLDSMSELAGGALGDEEHPGPLRNARRATEAEAEFAGDVGSVNVSSEPLGAEIYVDGKFSGQTPSTLHVSGGTHRIEIKADGRAVWVRELEITKGSTVSVKPTLAMTAAAPPASP